MSMRITTNGAIHSYKSNLMRSYKTLTDANEKVLTQRKFNSFAEDPSSASQAFKLRRSLWQTNAQITNNNTVSSKFSTAWSAIENISGDIGNDIAKVSSLTAISDGSASGRQALGQTLTSGANAIVQSMNVRYGDEFIFSGSDGLNVPFSFDDSGALQYRGVCVDATGGDYDKLTAMAGETTYVDVGLGLSEMNDGELIKSSAFDSSLSGINFLGYGVDEDGDPKNIISIMKQLGDVFSKCNENTGAYASDGDAEKADRLTKKLESAYSNLTVKHTELDVQASSLSTNSDRLDSLADTLNEQIIGIEQIDGADAITSLSWAQYCYNAALKIGTSILSQSLIDYMN